MRPALIGAGCPEPGPPWGVPPELRLGGFGVLGKPGPGAAPGGLYAWNPPGGTGGMSPAISKTAACGSRKFGCDLALDISG